MPHELGAFTLRKPEPGDADALYALKNDPAVASLLGGFSTGYSHDDIARWIDRHSKATDEAMFIVADEHDRCVGHVALYKIDHRVRSAELGIALATSVSGKGLGRACTRFALEYAFDPLNLHRVYLEVLATNERAVGLYRSLGFTEEGRLRDAQWRNGRYVDVLLFGILRDELRREP
jgi:RimJ/RimL family protein N-acetyltransferase